MSAVLSSTAIDALMGVRPAPENSHLPPTRVALVRELHRLAAAVTRVATALEAGGGVADAGLLPLADLVTEAHAALAEHFGEVGAV